MKQTPHPLISVIIPTKNEEKTLSACLESLNRQKTSVSFEILIIDTNSTDNTLFLAKKYGARIIKEPKPGRNIAHHTGAIHAKGNILLFTEADCVLPHHWIQTYVDSFTAQPHAVAFVGRYVYHQSTAALTLASRLLMPMFDTFFRMIHGHYAFRASNFGIRKSILIKAGGFNLKAREFDDVELSMRVSKHGKIVYIPRLVTNTGDRRVRGRLFTYLAEVSSNYIKTCILKQSVTQKVFADIR